MKNHVNSLLITFATAFTIPAFAQTIQTAGYSTAITAEQFINQAAISGMKEVATGKIAKEKAQDQKVKDFGSMMNKDHGKANTELIAMAKSKNIKLPKQDDIMPQTAGINNNATGTSGSQSENLPINGTNSTIKQTNTNTMPTTGNNTEGSTGNGKTMSTTVGNPTGMLNNKDTSDNGSNSQARSNISSPDSTTSSDSLKMVTPADVSSAIQELKALSGAQFDARYTQMMISDHKNAIALFERGSKSSDTDVKAFAIKHLPTLQMHLKLIQSFSGTNMRVKQTNEVPAGMGNR